MNAIAELMDLAKANYAGPPNYPQQAVMLRNYEQDQASRKNNKKPIQNTLDRVKPTMKSASKRGFSKVTAVKEMSRTAIGSMPRPKVVGNKKLKEPKYKDKYDE